MSASPVVLSNRELVRALREVSDTHSLTIAEIAAKSACSPVTVCALRGKGHPPKNRPTRLRLSRFITEARAARNRQELGLP